MKKSVLFLIALSGCVRLNYVDIPADPLYKFRYVGEDAVVECVDEKLAGRMCEKDGKTLANGTSLQDNTLVTYMDGKIVVMETNWEDIRIITGKGKTYDITNINSDKDENHKTSIIGAICGKRTFGSINNAKKTIKDFKRLTGGTNSCDFLKEEDIKQGNPEKKIIFKDAK